MKLEMLVSEKLGKAISESEENSNGKQKYYEKNKESKKKLSTH